MSGGTNCQSQGDNVVSFGHARVHLFYLKYERVGLCGMSLGCINTTNQSGILQVLWELIFTPTQSQTFIVVVGPEVILRISHSDVDREHHKDLTRAVCL